MVVTSSSLRTVCVSLLSACICLEEELTLHNPLDALSSVSQACHTHCQPSSTRFKSQLTIPPSGRQ
jgi:hypothetical protein